ncbi:odorant receptor 46a isoform X2 [Manduca sexta]|uniref:odorant receptor 46a isoform X2 n=1 Tax=Manduca sexta TaxID=7130 RepID=UPI0018908003|nr:odorant receptor 46a isoform X2 [Manduca sexta]
MAQNTELFLGRPKKILTFFGIWLPSKQYQDLVKIYMILVMITQYSFVLFEIIYIINVWGDIEVVSEASYLLFTQASVCYKTTAFLIKKRKLVLLLEHMEQEIFASQSKDHEKILLELSLRIKRLCTFFLTSAITTCTLWAMIPLFDDAGHKTFPFRIWMPVTADESPGYELGYLYQMVSIYISAFLFIAVDSVALSMIMFGCAQLDIIKDKMQKVREVPICLNVDEKKEKLKSNNDLFTECVRHYQNVISFVELVEETYHANIFFQLSGTVAIICNIGLRISISEVLRDWMYQCPWYDQDTKFKRTLWITMERMKKPIIFKAGHYISLSRPTFVAILRCSYSYFAVLNRANT